MMMMMMITYVFSGPVCCSWAKFQRIPNLYLKPHPTLGITYAVRC